MLNWHGKCYIRKHNLNKGVKMTELEKINIIALLLLEKTTDPIRINPISMGILDMDDLIIERKDITL